MGIVQARIKLSNPTRTDIAPIEVDCIVDSGATFLCIPEHVSKQLQLLELRSREVVLADGVSKMVPYAGPIKVEFENRECFVGAVVIGDQTLLGAIPMEDMDLVIHPRYLKPSVNPESPNFARGLAK